LFAEYIISAHSWYKHLPLHPKMPFFCFLDPQAGRLQSRDSATGAIIFSDADGKEIPHYTAQSTAMYRRRFGLWSYCNSFPSIGIVTFENYGSDSEGYHCTLTSQSTEGQVVIPPELLESGKAQLSALVHHNLDLAIWTRRANYIPDFYGLPTPLLEMVSDFPVPSLDSLSYQRTWELFKRLWALLNQESILPAEELHSIEEIRAVAKKLSAIRRLSYGPYWKCDWELLMDAKEIGLSEEQIGLVIRAHFANQAFRGWTKELKRVIGYSEGLTYPSSDNLSAEESSFKREQYYKQVEAIELPPHLKSLASLIVREKIRQLDGLEIAMHRFLKAVYE